MGSEFIVLFAKCRSNVDNIITNLSFYLTFSPRNKNQSSGLLCPNKDGNLVWTLVVHHVSAFDTEYFLLPDRYSGNYSHKFPENFSKGCF